MGQEVTRAIYDYAKQEGAMNQKTPAPGVSGGRLQYNIRKDIVNYEKSEIMTAATEIFESLVKNKCMFHDGAGLVRFISPADLEAEMELEDEGEAQ